jgi:thioester reductase-like protein
VSETVLLTGATGFLGMEVLARLLERDDVEVLALVRGRDRAAAQARLDAVLATLYEVPPADVRQRVRALPGDVTEEGLGLRACDRREVLHGVDSIVHCAASISFTLPLDEAREVNTAGTRRVIWLARDMDSPRRVVHVSTAYVAGRHEGRFRENQLCVGQAFRNTYEQSKHEAELLLADEAGDLPLVIARPSIVVGDSRSGWTPAFNVIYWPLQAFARGLLDRVPAVLDGVVDIVPVDYVADALVHLLADDEARGTVHLVAGDEAVTNAEMIELACDHFDRPRPRLVDAGAMSPLEHGDVYVPYFDVRTRFDDRRARGLLAPRAIAPPPLRDYFAAMIGYARAARWGKRPLTREAAVATAA